MKHPPYPQMAFSRFMKFSPKAFLFFGVAFVLIAAIAGHLIIQAPNDYQHGATGKILYIHVPSAWVATLCYTWMTTCALAVICRASLLADLCLKTSAPIGATFTLLTLVTGALWGQPAWGTWWVWDARLTSVLLLFGLYLAIIAVGFFYSRLTVAILTLFGFILVPIIKFSVVWWQTLHQPTSLWRKQGVAMEASMLQALIFMALAFLLLFILLQLLSLRARLLKEQGYQLVKPQLHPVSKMTKEPEISVSTLPVAT